MRHNNAPDRLQRTTQLRTPQEAAVQTTKLNLAFFYLTGLYFHLSKARSTLAPCDAPSPLPAPATALSWHAVQPPEA